MSIMNNAISGLLSAQRGLATVSHNIATSIPMDIAVRSFSIQPGNRSSPVPVISVKVLLLIVFNAYTVNTSPNRFEPVQLPVVLRIHFMN